MTCPHCGMATHPAQQHHCTVGHSVNAPSLAASGTAPYWSVVPPIVATGGYVPTDDLRGELIRWSDIGYKLQRCLQPEGSLPPGDRVMLAEWIIDETVIDLGRLRAENAALKADDDVNTQEITRYRDLWTQAADQATQLREDVRTLRAETERLTRERDELHAEYERGIGRKVGHLEAVLHLTNLIVNNQLAKDWGEKVEQERDALKAENTQIRQALGNHVLVPPDGGAESTVDVVRHLVARVAELEAERDALREDKARLDWLEVHTTQYPWTEIIERAAIDAARQGGEGTHARRQAEIGHQQHTCAPSDGDLHPRSP